MKTVIISALFAALLVFPACQCGVPVRLNLDSVTEVEVADSGPSGVSDAGDAGVVVEDSGMDASVDAGETPDAGDAGLDAGVDGGRCHFHQYNTCCINH